ncbi:phosphopantothenoylcysteine decarboxylase [Uncinocarpus reesii 1704]|uniref:Phosphopantothenoylcysteine decarboxylase n=1 Tax=Uncinocarpus reesii (strain UAMH 1704) TaxID=336963 RepID=C4JT68_UNCRE|nr:phosphopantothenoylcysteine decarboxylase [Uncinocarpus reesii 1704]EEP80815.1 phosphopantothenoylcysteine decarboxylase [Uncinocarpus reesii 1704]
MADGVAPELAPLFSAAEYINDGKLHILLAASGSVATIKLPNIAEALGRHANVSLRIVLTASSSKFLAGQSAEQPSLEQIRRLPNVDGIYQDLDEWKVPWVRGSSILHIELRRWAHFMLIAPLSANTLAKMALGLADNLLLSVVRAWDVHGTVEPARTIYVAPSMNTMMWKHPLTEKHIKTLERGWNADSMEGRSWITVLKPMEKELACGDTGDGAMRDWRVIVKFIEEDVGLDL